jgi:FKBP-type peptidyl-prolyl cis-trans isomerase (trigger factor)
MNVVVENLPNCLATLRVEVEPEKVSKAMEQLVRDFTQQARIPGYRPGKAPRAVIEKRYKKGDPRGTREEASRRQHPRGDRGEKAARAPARERR